jgi:hypothetical protein
MKWDFDVREFSTGLDALKTAHLDNLARAERERNMLRDGISSEEDVHRHIEEFTRAMDRTNELKAGLLSKLLAHRVPQVPRALPIEQRNTLSYHLAKARGQQVLA